LRAEQSENRSDLSLFEYDEKFEIIKFNPLLKWTLKEVEYYLENNVPQNTLHKQDLGIGVPCTRAISEDEDIRAGMVVESSHKECGLHQNKLLSTKLESSNKLKHKNINPFGFPFGSGG
jgi:phosphoadenosine phosphosulfate reductase